MTNPSRVPGSEYDRLGSEECPTTTTVVRQGLGRTLRCNTSCGGLSQSKPSPSLENMSENSDNRHGTFDPGRTKRDTHAIMRDATATTTSMRARSNTCPAPGMPEVTKRYVGRMSSLLGGFQKAVESSQSHPPRGYDAGVTVVADGQTEVDPVPEFFCDGARSTSGSRFDSRGDSPDLEADLMDPEFIANLVTVQDLDIVMEDCFPSSSPDPQEETPLCVVQERGGDFSTVTESAQQQASEEREARNIQGSCQEASGALGTNGDILTLQKEKHPKSDSGVGSTLGSPGKGFLSKEYEGYEYQGNGNLLFGELRPHESSHADPLGNYSGDEYETAGNGSPDSQHSARFPGGGSGYHIGIEFMPYSVPSSFEDITPPDSAVPLSPLEFPFDIQKRNELEPRSIKAMITFILDPLATNPTFRCFQGLCNQAKQNLFRGKICWLRDLEKFLLLGPAVHLSRSYKSFCEAFVQGCKEALAHIREQDQRRSYDPDYSEAYFIDTLHHLKQKADMSVQSLDREASADIGTTKNRMNRPANPHSVSLRSVDSPKVANPQQYFVPQSAAVKAHPRQLHAFRQPLAIQTQPFMGRYNNHHELGGSSPRDSTDAGLPMNPIFNFEKTTRVGIAEVHLNEIDEYHGGGTREALSAPGISLSSTAPGGYSGAMTGQLTGYTLPPTPASAQSSPVARPYVGLSNTLIVGGAAPAQGAGPGEGSASVFSCNLCSKEFPRACDLTKHKKTHERPFKCEVVTCKYHTLGFPTGKERERHENDIHSSDSKKWSCQFPPCTYKSKRESNCKQHMEKTHDYEYQRMKRNPRKKAPLAPVAGAGVRKKYSGNGKPAASSSALKAVKALEQQQQSKPRGAAASSSQGVPTPDGFAGYHGYHQQTGVPNFGFIQPSHPPQMVNLREPPLFDGSPTTDFEPSPAPCAPGYGNPPNAYHAGGSTIDHPDWLPEPQSQREFLESFLSDFPQGNSHFAGIQQQMQEHPLPNSHQFGSSNPQFDEGMDCEWEGDSPD